MIKRIGTIFMVLISVINIIYFILFDEHNRYEGVVVSTLLVIMLVVYEIWTFLFTTSIEMEE